MARPNEALDYAMQYGRGQSKDTIDRFIRMYVNDVTIEMGVLGEPTRNGSPLYQLKIGETDHPLRM